MRKRFWHDRAREQGDPKGKYVHNHPSAKFEQRRRLRNASALGVILAGGTDKQAGAHAGISDRTAYNLRMDLTPEKLAEAEEYSGEAIGRRIKRAFNGVNNAQNAIDVLMQDQTWTRTQNAADIADLYRAQGEREVRLLLVMARIEMDRKASSASALPSGVIIHNAAAASQNS